MPAVPLNTQPPLWAFGGGPGLVLVVMAFQEHRTVTDGGLLLNGTVRHVIVLSGVALWIG